MQQSQGIGLVSRSGPSGVVYWEFRYRLNGQRHRVRVGRPDYMTLDEAWHVCRAHQILVDQGLHPPTVKNPPKVAPEPEVRVCRICELPLPPGRISLHQGECQAEANRRHAANHRSTHPPRKDLRRGRKRRRQVYQLSPIQRANKREVDIERYNRLREEILAQQSAHRRSSPSYRAARNQKYQEKSLVLQAIVGLMPELFLGTFQYGDGHCIVCTRIVPVGTASPLYCSRFCSILLETLTRHHPPLRFARHQWHKDRKQRWKEAFSKTNRQAAIEFYYSVMED
jgi:hypothetical protein